MNNKVGTILNRIIGKQGKTVKILIVGLDAAGKTTTLYKLKQKDALSIFTTIGYNVEQFQYKDLEFTAWDVGGKDKLRSLWETFYKHSQGIVFVVDSADSQRVGDAKEELMRMLQKPKIGKIPVLILANKQDLPGAMSETKLTDQLGLTELSNAWHIQGACATTGQGLYEGVDWIMDHLLKEIT